MATTLTINGQERSFEAPPEMAPQRESSRITR
jgi:hypothetical protein